MSHGWHVNFTTTGTITAPVATAALALRDAQIASHHTVATTEDGQFWTAALAALNALFDVLDPNNTALIEASLSAEGMHAGFTNAGASMSFQLRQPGLDPTDVHHWETEAIDRLNPAELILFNNLLSARWSSKGYSDTTQDVIVRDALIDLANEIEQVLDPGGTASTFNVRASATVSVGNLNHVAASLSVVSIQPGAIVPLPGVPIGGIIMWSGTLATIPSGFVLCNGANGTPDLRDRFVRGAADGQNPGATGGTASHAHAAHPDHTGIITHTHPVTDPGHAHNQQRHATATGALTGIVVTPDTSSSSPAAMGPNTASATTGITTQTPAGSVAAYSHSTHDSVSHLPTFYAIAFIQRVS